MKKALMLALVSIMPMLFFVAPASASAVDDGKVCTGLDSGKINVDGNVQEVTITADAGFLISGYCVKAGSVKKGNGPVYVDVDPDAASVTFSYPGGKDISHYSYSQVEIVVDEPDCDDEDYAAENPEECNPPNPNPTKVYANVTFVDPTCKNPNGANVILDVSEGVVYHGWSQSDVKPGGFVTVFATAESNDYVLKGQNEWDWEFAYLEGCGEEPPVDVCEEDEPCWDCETDGNGDCDEPNEPNEPNKPNKPEQPNEPKQPKQPTLPATGGGLNLTLLAIAAAMLLGGGLLVRASRV